MTSTSTFNPSGAPHDAQGPGPQASPIDWSTLDDRPDPAAAATEASAHPVLDVRVRLTVRLGEAELSIGELTQARAGSVLALDRRLDQPVDLLLNGHVVARGELVAIDDVFAIRLTEPPAPLRI